MRYRGNQSALRAPTPEPFKERTGIEIFPIIHAFVFSFLSGEEEPAFVFDRIHKPIPSPRQYLGVSRGPWAGAAPVP